MSEALAAVGKQLADTQNQVNILSIKDSVAKQTLQEIIATNIEIKTQMVMAQGQVNRLMQEKMALVKQITDLTKENERLNNVVAALDKAIGEKGKDTEAVVTPETLPDDQKPQQGEIQSQGSESDGA